MATEAPHASSTRDRPAASAGHHGRRILEGREAAKQLRLEDHCLGEHRFFDSEPETLVHSILAEVQGMLMVLELAFDDAGRASKATGVSEIQGNNPMPFVGAMRGIARLTALADHYVDVAERARA